jgi:predicted SprT family Zn-dependent metalloprotease
MIKSKTLKLTSKDLELKKLAENLYREMFGEDLNLDNVKFNSRISRKLGYVKGIKYYKTQHFEIMELGISNKLIDDMDRLIKVIKHELIHVYCIREYGEHGHGYYFKKLSIKFKIHYVNNYTGRLMFTCS